MSRALLRDALGWGLVLWLIGYVLGILLFFVLPPAVLGWVILPIGLVITLWVLFAAVKGATIRYYGVIAVVWTALAVVLDYLFIVRLFHPADGYYRPDVYLYYSLTFVLPFVVGFFKTRRAESG
ncbi:MAG: hypothetical protein KGJ78_03330 [Alphaproteobacteria bacterium]|nr:hypothetical protein [Alphaproteobacteria bacterium]